MSPENYLSNIGMQITLCDIGSKMHVAITQFIDSWRFRVSTNRYSRIVNQDKIRISEMSRYRMHLRDVAWNVSHRYFISGYITLSAPALMENQNTCHIIISPSEMRLTLIYYVLTSDGERIIAKHNFRISQLLRRSEFNNRTDNVCPVYHLPPEQHFPKWARHI